MKVSKSSPQKSTSKTTKGVSSKIGKPKADKKPGKSKKPSSGDKVTFSKESKASKEQDSRDTKLSSALKDAFG